MVGEKRNGKNKGNRQGHKNSWFRNIKFKSVINNSRKGGLGIEKFWSSGMMKWYIFAEFHAAIMALGSFSKSSKI